MRRVIGYRSYALAVAASLLPFAGGLTGCSGEAPHKTQKVEMRERWNGARIGVMHQLAKQQYEAGDYEKCRETLMQAASLNAPYAPISIIAAKLEIEKGNLENASAHLKTAQRIDPANAEAFFLAGVVCQRWQKLDDARDYYMQAWAKKPTEASYLLAVVEMQLTMGEVDEARSLLLEKIGYFEQTAAVRVALARTYMLKGEHEEAARAYREAVLLSPDDVALKQTYGEALFFAGKYSEALPVLEFLRRAPTVADRSNLTMVLGETYLKLRRSRDARLCFQEITQDNPNHMQAWLALGKTYLHDNDPVQAIQSASRVLRAEPENVQALVIKALAQQKQRRWKDAQETLREAHRVAPKDATVICMLGVSAQNLGEKQEALNYFEQAVTLSPNDAWAQELLASVQPAAAKGPSPDQ